MKFKNILSLICNLAIVGLVGFSVYSYIAYGGVGNMTGKNPFYYYYTFDSNILCAIASLFLLINNIVNIFRKEASFSFTLVLFKMTGTVAVSLTFVVVYFWLSRVIPGVDMYDGTNIFLHGVCPVLAVASFCLFESGDEFNISSFIMPTLLTAIYGGIYVYNAVFAGNWTDFYSFNSTGQWYIMVALVLLVGVIIAIIEIIIHNIVSKIDKALFKKKD